MFELSIAIPTYNRANSLNKLLTNLVTQTAIDRAEIIVSDNGSTDFTRQVVEKFRGQLNINLVGFESNQGFDRNYVNCVDAASGRFLWVMGDDDLLVAGAVSDVLSHLGNNDTDILICNGGDYRDGKLVARVNYQPGKLQSIDGLISNLGWLICWIGTTVVRRSVLRTNFLIPADFNAFVHLPLLVRSASAASRISFHQPPLIHTTINNSDYFKSPISLVRTFGEQLYSTLDQLARENLLTEASVRKTVRGFNRYLGMFGVKDMMVWKRSGLIGFPEFLRNIKYFSRVNKFALVSGFVLLIPRGAINLLYSAKRNLLTARRKL